MKAFPEYPQPKNNLWWHIRSSRHSKIIYESLPGVPHIPKIIYDDISRVSRYVVINYYAIVGRSSIPQQGNERRLCTLRSPLSILWFFVFVYFSAPIYLKGKGLFAAILLLYIHKTVFYHHPAFVGFGVHAYKGGSPVAILRAVTPTTENIAVITGNVT